MPREPVPTLTAAATDLMSQGVIDEHLKAAAAKAEKTLTGAGAVFASPESKKSD